MLPGRGLLLVSTDLHGNLADFERLRAIFRALDLGARYRSVSDLRDGVEIERLWPHPVGAEGVV